LPFGVAAILGAGVLGSSLISGNAAQSAASTQANAANNAANLQQQQFNTTQQHLVPYLTTGTNANNILADLLGIPNNVGGSAVPGAGQLLQNPLSQLGPIPQYNMPAYAYQQSPGYAVALQGGTSALQNAGATTTGALSGNILQALQGFGTQQANQDYQQNYQNYATNYGNQFNANNANFWNQYNALNQGNTNTFNWLSQLAGTGQNAGANLGTIGTTAAANTGNALIGAGNAQAAGTVGAANAAAGGLNSLSTLLTSPSNSLQNSFIGSLLNNNGGIYGTQGTGGL
jgi:hypothetical protein